MGKVKDEADQKSAKPLLINCEIL